MKTGALASLGDAVCEPVQFDSIPIINGLDLPERLRHQRALRRMTAWERRMRRRAERHQQPWRQRRRPRALVLALEMHGDRLTDAKRRRHQRNGDGTLDLLNAEQSYPVSGRAIGLAGELGQVSV